MSATSHRFVLSEPITDDEARERLLRLRDRRSTLTDAIDTLLDAFEPAAAYRILFGELVPTAAPPVPFDRSTLAPPGAKAVPRAHRSHLSQIVSGNAL